MARDSRPPGFDMSYRPERSVTFAPPIRERLPSLFYMTVAIAITTVIVYGQHAPSNSRLFHYVVEGDAHRIISSSVCAIILLVSAAASLSREMMRGVIVRPDGVELRELLSLGWPRVRRFAWSQIDKVVVSPGVHGKADPKSVEGILGSVRLDLWDGSRAWLPHVSNAPGLAMMLEKVALARAIPIEGGTGIVEED